MLNWSNSWMLLKGGIPVALCISRNTYVRSIPPTWNILLCVSSVPSFFLVANSYLWHFLFFFLKELLIEEITSFFWIFIYFKIDKEIFSLGIPKYGSKCRPWSYSKAMSNCRTAPVFQENSHIVFSSLRQNEKVMPHLFIRRCTLTSRCGCDAASVHLTTAAPLSANPCGRVFHDKILALIQYTSQ